MEYNLEHPFLIPEKGLPLLQELNDLVRELLSRKEHVYKNGDLEIIIHQTPVNNSFINVIHKGWIYPSMYNDSPPDSGLGTILYRVQDNIIILVMEFEADDYSRQTYLKFSFSSDHDTITILEGAHKGEILTLVK